MSQVIVPHDLLSEKRQRTRLQEQQIDTESRYAKWRMSDVTKRNPVLAVIGVATLPILFLWGMLTLAITFSMLVTGALLKVMMGIFGRRA